MDFIKSFLSLFAVLLSFSDGGFVGEFLLLGFSFGIKGSLLLFHDLFVLFNSLGVHLDGGVAQSAVISIPVLSHIDSRSTIGAGLSVFAHVSAFYIKKLNTVNGVEAQC